MEIVKIPIICLSLVSILSKTVTGNTIFLNQTHYVNECREQIKFKRSTLNCCHGHLFYIPKTKPYIQNLLFSFNNLANLTTETFVNISNPKNIVELELDHNRIRNISSDCFDVFLNLKYLNVSYNPIYYDNLKDLFGALSKMDTLFHLGISGINTINISQDLFSLMGKNNVGTVVAQHYDMTNLDMNSFSKFNALESFYLRNNDIRTLSLFKHEMLYSLYLDHNNLESFPDFTVNKNESDCYFENLEILNIQNNKIDHLSKQIFICLLKLTNLKAGENPISVLPDNLISQLPFFVSLKLRNLNGGRLQIHPYAFNSTSLKKLHVGFGGAATEIFRSFNDTFKFLPNLTSLILDRIGMLQINSSLIHQLFNPLNKLIFFECFACQIHEDPKLILSHMKRLDRISLQSNLLTELSVETFKENKHLRYLSLRLNQIGHIHESALPISFLNQLYQLDLSQNPFVCDCDLEWLINWMKEKKNKKVIQKYPEDYKCLLPKEMKNKQLSGVSFTYKECHPWNPWIWVAIIASPCVIIISITVLILYRNRWNIKHYIYLLRKRRNYQKVDGQNYMYDAFVGYVSEDSAWVRRRLLPVLEDEVGLKLCIHERDFQPGVFINDNIVINMDRSERIILILTNEFALSAWCMFELKIAHSKLIKEEAELVVIMLEKIDGRNMNHSLKVLFETTTYLEWTEDVEGQKLFWMKLKSALKK